MEGDLGHCSEAPWISCGGQSSPSHKQRVCQLWCHNFSGNTQAFILFSFFSFVKAKLLERIVCFVQGVNGLNQSFLGLSSTFFKLLVILQNLDLGASLLDESFPKFSEVIMPSFGLFLYLICNFVVALILFALQIFTQMYVSFMGV